MVAVELLRRQFHIHGIKYKGASSTARVDAVPPLSTQVVQLLTHKYPAVPAAAAHGYRKGRRRREPRHAAGGPGSARWAAALTCLQGGTLHLCSLTQDQSQANSTMQLVCRVVCSSGSQQQVTLRHPRYARMPAG